MKQTIMIAALAMTIALFSGCGKNENVKIESASKTIVAEKEITIEGSPIRLPVGTKVTPSADAYELQVELPEGYSFLTEKISPKTGVQERYPLMPYVAASYKCKCSASNGSSCQVFYQKDAGFGCLHQDCGGTCTGDFTTLQYEKVSGILNLNNEEVSAKTNEIYAPASLSSKGFEDFFTSKEVQEKIAGQYELLYKNIAKPDFRDAGVTGTFLKNYVYLKVKLYGVSFYMLAPREVTQLSTAMEAFGAESVSCSCDNGNGSCKKKSKGFLGWTAYWCEGSCNGCVMTVTD